MKRLLGSYPGVAATLALVLAIGGGTAVALKGKNSVDSGDIKNHQVKADDLAQPKLIKVKTNPVQSDNPCSGGITLVFCGSNSGSGFRGWSNVGGTRAPASFWRNGFGEVHLTGYVDSSLAVASTGEEIFRLPNGYRPQHQLEFPASCEPEDCDTAENISIDVYPDGRVLQSGGDYRNGVSLDGITYLAK